MCIDKPEHMTQGRPELTRAEVDPELDHWEFIKTFADWGAVADWLEGMPEHMLEFTGAHATPAGRAALAECHIRDWANAYGWCRVNGRIAIYASRD